MRQFVLMIAVVMAWASSVQALSEYLTSIDRYGFYKVLVSGTMDDDNLIATCAAAGMRHACFHSGTGACAFHWSPDCIKYDHDGVSCITTENLAQILCGDPDKLYCPPLDDVFVVRPNYWGEVVGWGIDVDTHQHFGDGSSYNNMYALCAVSEGLQYMPCMNGGTLDNFVCQCPPWATGFKCETDRIDDCQGSPCQNGTCTDHPGFYTCRCEPGWTGVNCDTEMVDECLTSPCLHGACVDHLGGYTCRCDSGWTGVNCETELVDECLSNPCYMGACVDHQDHYTCRCDPGWTGIHCDVDMVDECVSNPCLMGACVDHQDHYTCRCDPGWTGVNCDVDMVDECQSNPCVNGACVDHQNHYHCQCDPGWTGIHCDVDMDDCSSSPCPSNSTCVDEVNGYTCQCAPGWEGDQCQTDIDECSTSLCPANATCVDGVNSYTCLCKPGWTGSSCETEINECASNPCLSDGTCVDEVDGYKCICPEWTTGANCETVLFSHVCYMFSLDTLSHKDAAAACTTMGGHLTDVHNTPDQQMMAFFISHGSDVSHWTAAMTSAASLISSDGSPVSSSTWMSPDAYGPYDQCVLLDSQTNYQGNYHVCSEEHNYICESYTKDCQLCQNGGVCTSCFNNSVVKCECQPGFTGDLCEKNIDECASSPCQNNGTCVDGVDKFDCVCDRGYTGVLCEQDLDLCHPNPCPYGWTCVDNVHGLSCEIPVRGAETEYCTKYSCGPGWHCREDGPTGFSCITG
ncbi:PREDICTED: fibropellin-1-like isoform X2 [Branchiostoma belcheri]|uniref:Fibropellin-1-like isoform X2 n=1 Tax=Branchiostoma belcheri TaxID=7741 RepID=A0A6P4ZKX2_BRABE|nr:PREDICTED: fibropellin-1-like isoform X2 [Branchiostoma belcheri]